MRRLLTTKQAEAIAGAILALAAIDGRASRMTIARRSGTACVSVKRDGQVLISCHSESGRLWAKERYDNIASFARAYEESA